MRSTRRLVQRVHRLGRQRSEAAQQAMRKAYAQLIAVATQTQRQAVRIYKALAPQAEAAAQRVAGQIATFLPRVAQVIRQATRRTLHGETVPAGEKIVSVFEPHTQIIVRNKAGKPVEFGRKLWLAEVEGGIISGWRVLDTPGPDAPYLMPSLTEHRQRFGKPPFLVAADRGVFSPQNDTRAKQAGVKRVAIPATGRANSIERAHMERQRWFRRGFRFRAGIEGRISVLQRAYGLDRCRDHDEAGMGRWIGWGIVTANLERIARTQVQRMAGGAL
jgi:IS5 family transposase